MAITVICVRHAKAKEDGNYPDELIPISDDGRESTSKVAKYLKKHGYKADLVLSSDLLRAKQTAHLFADEFRCPVQKDYCLNPDSYNIERVISKLPTPAGAEGLDRTILIIGHDPSIADVANQLCGKKNLKGGMAKLGVAIVTFDGDVELKKGKFVEYKLPEDMLKKKK